MVGNPPTPPDADARPEEILCMTFTRKADGADATVTTAVTVTAIDTTAAATKERNDDDG